MITHTTTMTIARALAAACWKSVSIVGSYRATDERPAWLTRRPARISVRTDVLVRGGSLCGCGGAPLLDECAVVRFPRMEIAAQELTPFGQDLTQDARLAEQPLHAAPPDGSFEVQTVGPQHHAHAGEDMAEQLPRFELQHVAQRFSAAARGDVGVECHRLVFNLFDRVPAPQLGHVRIGALEPFGV